MESDKLKGKGETLDMLSTLNNRLIVMDNKFQLQERQIKEMKEILTANINANKECKVMLLTKIADNKQSGEMLLNMTNTLNKRIESIEQGVKLVRSNKTTDILPKNSGSPEKENAGYEITSFDTHEPDSVAVDKGLYGSFISTLLMIS